MRVFFWFLLLLPLLELYLLIRVGSETGAMGVVLWIILTALAGIMCIRVAGVATAMGVRERMARGEVPDRAMLSGLLWVVGGVLLFIPGFLTDFAGLLCVLPLSRSWLAGRMRRNGPQTGPQAAYQRTSAFRESSEADSQVIEGEFERKEKD